MRPNNAPERKKREKIDRRKGKRFWEKNGKKLEPVEQVYLDIQEEHVGIVTEKLSNSN